MNKTRKKVANNLRQVVAEYQRRKSALTTEVAEVEKLLGAALLLLNSEIGRPRNSGTAHTPASDRPYVGLTVTQGIEMILQKNGTSGMHANEITKCLIDGGWATNAKKPFATVVVALRRRPDLFEQVGKNTFRTKGYNGISRVGR